ncbi:MAG: hypothetical protein ACOY0T_27920 [Myxococcota bacterium]
MVQRRPELHKKPGVHYAFTNDGLELPLVDITHEAFALNTTPAQQRALTSAFMREQAKFAKLPDLVQRALLRVFLRGSILADALRKSEGTFLTGLGTYLLKLPPDMLGSAYSRPVDRRIASALPALSVRLRLQDMAELAAGAIAPALASEPSRALWFVNIAGGPAFDSLNALLLLNRKQRELLEDRIIRIRVLDADDTGPNFGARALAQLSGRGAPLWGLDVRFEHQSFDWSDPAGLREALEQAEAEHAFTLGASEGGLFEYGSDADILSILSEFRDGASRLLGIVGSVTRDDEVIAMLKKTSKAATRPRGLPVFERLCRSVGYEISQAIERPVCDDVLIRPQR